MTSLQGFVVKYFFHKAISVATISLNVIKFLCPLFSSLAHLTLCLFFPGKVASQHFNSARGPRDLGPAGQAADPLPFLAARTD